MRMPSQWEITGAAIMCGLPLVNSAVAQLGGAGLGGPVTLERTFPTVDPAALRVDRDAAFEQRVDQAMGRIVPMHFDGLRLDNVVMKLSLASGLPMYLDPKGMTDAAVDPAAPVTFSADRLTLRAGLEAMLDEFDLTWTVQRERVVVTSREKADEILTTKVFPVSDLVGSPQNWGSLLNLITSTIQPDSWDDNGGPGSIQPCRPGDLLVISQKRDVHEEIADLLVMIRRQTGTVPRAWRGGVRTAIGSGQPVVARYSDSFSSSLGDRQSVDRSAANRAIYLSNRDGLQIVGGLYGAKCRVRPGRGDDQ